MSDLDLDALRKMHGRITQARYNGHDIVFRKPTQGEAQMWRSAPADTAEERYEQMSTMAQFILVHPTVVEFNALLEDYPFMLSNEGINRAISMAMGVIEEKKDSTASVPPKKATPNASPAVSPSGSPSAREAS